MLIVNNPANPVGSYLDKRLQLEVLNIAAENGLIVLADEIFRPFFHSGRENERQEQKEREQLAVPSLIEHGYGKVVVTSSLSKVWGLTGSRLGWMVTRDESLLKALRNTRQYTFQLCSAIDETIAAEVLGPRCRPALLKFHLMNAQENLSALRAFVIKNHDICSWTEPSAGSTAFIKLSWHGAAIDDVTFCQTAFDEEGLLLIPGSLCFRAQSMCVNSDGRDFMGYVRVHFTYRPYATVESLKVWDRLLQRARQDPGKYLKTSPPTFAGKNGSDPCLYAVKAKL
jgi:aspartate/methionine/tyrosine aminotransferase